MGAGIRLALTRSLRSAATSPPSIAHNTRAALAGRVTPLECRSAKTAKMGAIRAQIRAMGASWVRFRPGCPHGSNWGPIGSSSGGSGVFWFPHGHRVGSRTPRCSGGPAARLWRRSTVTRSDAGRLRSGRPWDQITPCTIDVRSTDARWIGREAYTVRFDRTTYAHVVGHMSRP